MSDDVQKITVNLPVSALERARRITGKGITATVLEGLEEIARRERRVALASLKGRVDFELDVEATRQ